MTLNDVIKHFGSEREAAYQLKYTQQSFRHWRKKKTIPAKAQRLIELMTNGKLKAKELK